MKNFFFFPIRLTIIKEIENLIKDLPIQYYIYFDLKLVIKFVFKLGLFIDRLMVVFWELI